MTKPSFASVIAAYPPAPRKRFNELRALLLSEAERLEVGPLQETLKWGQPSFLTPRRSGTTVRLHWSEKLPTRVQFLVHCQTSLVEEWRETFGPVLDYEGTRAVYVPVSGDYPGDIIAQCFASALTYHRR